MSKNEAVDGLQGVKFRVFFDLDVIEGEHLREQLIQSLKQKFFVQGFGGEYRGAQAKFWYDIQEDENYSGMGNVIAYIAEGFSKYYSSPMKTWQNSDRKDQCRILCNTFLELLHILDCEKTL